MIDCYHCGQEIDTDYYQIDMFGEYWCEYCWPDADERLFG